MTKLITRTMVVFCIAFLSLNTTFNLINIQAGKIDKIKHNAQSILSEPKKSYQKPKDLKPEIRIIDRKKTLELEPDIQMTKEQEKNFKKCQKDESEKRSKRNKIKPTACRKNPTQVTEELTDQDYTILYDTIQEKEDENKGLDMNKELTLDEIMKDFKNISSTSSSSSSSNSSSESSTSNTNSFSSKNTSSSLTSSSESSFFSSNNSSVSSLSNSNYSSQRNSTNSSVSSISNPISPISQNTSDSNNNQSSSNPLSFLNLFGGVKAEAQSGGAGQGTKVDGYRLPYPSGTRIVTYKTMNSPITPANPTHAGRNAIDFASYRNNFEYYNADIVAAKEGRVVAKLSSAYGFGNHIVIKQNDGHYAVYGHLSSLFKNVNDYVQRGEKIGVQGNTGNSTDPHLHFEVVHNSVGNLSNCGEAGVFAGCYNYSLNNSSNQIIPQFDECFTNRGGQDQNECTKNGVNTGFPYIDQSYLYGYYWTSINSSTPPPFNPYNGMIRSSSNYNFVFDVDRMDPTNQTKVQLWGNNGSMAQKWDYNWGTQQIVGLNNKCLDAGVVSSDPNLSWLRINDCHNGGNQKFWADQLTRIHSAANPNLCIDSWSGNTQGSKLYLSNCHFNDNQRWGNTTFGIQNNINNVGPTPKFRFKQNGTTMCLEAKNPYQDQNIYTKECTNIEWGQIWDWVPSGYANANMMRVHGTNLCVTSDNPMNNRYGKTRVYLSGCWAPNPSQNWYHGNLGYNNLLQFNTDMCVDVYKPTNDKSAYMWPCANAQNHNWVPDYWGNW
jgi:murein DD-endopeptidase MepM/ murein hydrolase activator NlpD